jgi:iron complex outermembrane receptor protein
VFLFTQNYDQDAVNTYAPFVLSPFINIPVDQHTPVGSLDDTGVGVYGNGTFAFGNKVDVTVGARVDHENKKADLSTYLSGPTIQSIPQVVNDEKGYSNVAPQAAVSFRFKPEALAYFSVTGGYKAGGWNPTSPQGNEAYDQEKTWNYEGGVKLALAGRRATANVAVFTIDWDDLQLNLPNPQVPGQFYITNIGTARSSGFEFELNGRARDGVDLFATVGYTHARFGSGTISSGLDVSDNKVPNTPVYTTSFGADLSHRISSALRLYGRAEAVFYGAFNYDDLNLAEQDAYSLANFRGGVRARNLFVEGWVRNAFDTTYVPVAFAYGQLAPSGFVGESGRPRTFGLTAGVSF